MDSTKSTHLNKILNFFDEIKQELKQLFSSQYIKYYIHEDCQDLFIQYSNDIKRIIDERITDAKSFISSHYKSIIEKLRNIGWSEKEFDFKLGVWEIIKNRVGIGWEWLKSKLDIMNVYLGSLSSIGVTGAEALKEIKGTYEASKKGI